MTRQAQMIQWANGAAVDPRGSIFSERLAVQMTSEAGPIRDRGEPVPGTDAESSPVGSARLSDFKILREIGRGGQSIVYEARQLSLRRKVALKRLPSAAVFDQRWLARFQNEVRAAAQLNHPQHRGLPGDRPR